MEKKRPIGLIVFVFLFIILVILKDDTVFACSCPGTENPRTEFSKAHGVFIGKVIGIKKKSEYYYDVEFSIIKLYKSSKELGLTSENRLVMTSTLQSKSCDFPFKEDKEYLIYMYAWGGKRGVSTCGRTRKLSEATEDLKVLDEITVSSTPR
jgi:hypothetical protein